MEHLRTRGRAAKEVEFEVIGPLTGADLALLDGEKGSKPSALKRLGERHHALARLIAEGRRPSEAAMIMGYDVSRVSILQDDPAFAELVKFYAADQAQVYRGLHEKLAGISSDAMDLIQDRLETVGDKVPLKELRELAQMGADRTGAGPTSTQVNVNVGIGDRLEAARRRVAERTLELTVNREAAE